MRFSSFVCAFLTTGCALVHPSLAYNSRSCDDLSHLKSNCPVVECHAPNIQALHHGCYVCVDPETCRSPMTLPLAPASNEARETIALSSAQNDHAGEKGIEVFPEHVADEAMVAPATPVNIQGVSNVYFLIPACLALVSVGLALRNRMVIADIEFERVDGDDHDELNPFCTDARCNPQHGEGDLEYGDPKDGEDE